MQQTVRFAGFLSKNDQQYAREESSWTYSWWFRNPKQPPGMYKNPINNGINYQPPLVSGNSEPPTILPSLVVSQILGPIFPVSSQVPNLAISTLLFEARRFRSFRMPRGTRTRDMRGVEPMGWPRNQRKKIKVAAQRSKTKLT